MFTMAFVIPVSLFLGVFCSMGLVYLIQYLTIRAYVRQIVKDNKGISVVSVPTDRGILLVKVGK